MKNAVAVAAMVISVLSAALTLGPRAAMAAQGCSIPFSLTNGTTADATQVMSNFSAVAACTLSGFFSGAVVAGSATVGATTPGDVWASRSVNAGQLNAGGSGSSGSIDYGVSVAGQMTLKGGTALRVTVPVVVNAGTASAAFVPPLLGFNGTGWGSNSHTLFGTCTFSASTACLSNLTGAAPYLNSSSYACFASWVGSNVGGRLTVTTNTLAQIEVDSDSSNSGQVGVACIGGQ